MTNASVAQPSRPLQMRHISVAQRSLGFSATDRWQFFNSWAQPNRAFANLPALELEDALHRVRVELEQISHRPVSERRVLLDHLLDRLHQPLLQLRRRLGRLVIDRPARDLKPPTQFADRDIESVLLESLADRLDHFSSSPSRDCNFFLARSSSIASP
jgi:hypothetical protein